MFILITMVRNDIPTRRVASYTIVAKGLALDGWRRHLVRNMVRK